MRGFFLFILVFGAGILDGPAQNQVIQKFDGATDTTTPAFTVKDNWEIQWDSPTPVQLTLFSADGTLVAVTSGLVRGSFFQPKGGTFYLHLNGVTGKESTGGMAPWRIRVMEVGLATGLTRADSLLDPNFVPPTSAVSTASDAPAAPVTASTSGSTNSVAAPAAPTPPAPPANVPPTAKLTEDQARAVVLVKGDNAEGTGFLVKTADGPVMVTNLHVISANPNLKILTNTGAQITTLSLKGAVDRDLAMFSIKDANYSYLDLAADISNSVETGDELITPGNSEGGEVVLETRGKVVALGPERIEIDNPIYHGNSGGPIVHIKTGKVLGVVTMATKVNMTNDLDKASFQNSSSAITGSMRYFGLRLDTVPQWETYDWNRFLNETFFLKQFHHVSRCLDSLLNGAHYQAIHATDDGENGSPDAKYYLTDDKVRKAHDNLVQMAGGADSSQRVNALRELLFDLSGIADQDMEPIQNKNNFYSFDQIRAEHEIAYRKALKAELDSLGNNISRLGNAVLKSN